MPFVMGRQRGETVDAAQMRIHDLQEKYAERPAGAAYERLYQGGAPTDHMAAVMHETLDRHFAEINGRARTTGHYWAANSRELIDRLVEIKNDLHSLKRAGLELAMSDNYQSAIERIEPWLSPSGGSAVPSDFEQVEIDRYSPAFVEIAGTVALRKATTPVDLKMIGNGSFADVYAYTDPDYGIKFAVKRAKRGISEQDFLRFRKEFDLMKGMNFPYVVAVYKFDESKRQYSMEYCDKTLRQYINERNASLKFATRKRIALQFLYGLFYLHSKDLLHRDISLQNVLVKVHEGDAVTIKLSDFGLAKEVSAEFTRTGSEMKGTVLDPMLDSFKDYGIRNEIFAVGHVLAFIFTGSTSLTVKNDDLRSIIQKCTTLDVQERYLGLSDLIRDVEKIEVPAVRISA